ncbi:MAG: hypothetical protein NT013_12680 [Planctomycetia bacterium]|nr:hypothetical protein [Planctomycetia bacterium]
MPQNSGSSPNFVPLTTMSKLMCPHGGSVQIAAARLRPIPPRQGSIVTENDSFNVCGCGFAPAGPSPCLRVVWLASNSDLQVDGQNTLNYTSIGQCVTQHGIVQGPVIIVAES